MEKCGMKCEGTLQKYGFVKGKHIDLKVYSIIKEGM